MSNKSDICGRAFEYACFEVLTQELGRKSVAVNRILDSSAAEHAVRSWRLAPKAMQSKMLSAARELVAILFDTEPMLVDGNKEPVYLSFQPDAAGEAGDVRDILISRKNDSWEIGLSLKHNHFAVKHSRLSRTIDFGNIWYGLSCAEDYHKRIAPIFDRLDALKSQRVKWCDVEDKTEKVYVPLLNAFKSEIERAAKLKKDFAKRIVEYLIGTYDYYKAVGKDADQETEVMPFNIRGVLNQEGHHQKRKITIMRTKLPSQLVAVQFKNGSSTTLEMYFDEGWSFSFRIHSASTLVEPSLKFDVQFLGLPASIVQCTIVRKWKTSR